MSLLQAIILGLVQGLSEFLPISSTAHLTLAGRAFGLVDPSAPEHWTAFIAIVQLGTLVAVLVYFHRDLVIITRNFVQENLARKPFRQQSLQSRTGWYIIIGTIPVVVIGLAFKPVIEGTFTKNLIVIGTSLLLLGLLLELAERVARFKRPIEDVNTRDSLLIGFAQAFALIPGSSRSGTTITAGLFLGLTREAAARFSFLLSIPAVAASALLEVIQEYKHLDANSTLTIVVATVVAGLSGYWTIAFLLHYLRTRTTRIFVVYRIVVGGAMLLAIASGYLLP